MPKIMHAIDYLSIITLLVVGAGLVPGCFLEGLWNAVLGSYAFTAFLALPLLLPEPPFSDSPRGASLC